MIIFTHIARTSGKMIERFLIPKNLKQHYKSHKMLMKIGQDGNYKLEKCDVLTGHTPYGIHKYIKMPGKVDQVSYFTFLRNPVDRWKSEFNHSIVFKSFIRPVWKTSKNIFDFFDRCVEEERNTNIMTKQLSGLELFTDVIQDYKNYMYMWAARKRKYSSFEMDEMLKESINNLKNNYRFVGITGNKDSYNGLCKSYRWRFKTVKKTNSAAINNLIQWDNPRIVQIINKMNEYDLKLYNIFRETMC